jgi:hypothetical protein
MQDSAFAVGALIYAAAAVHAWTVLPGAASFKLQRMVLFPGVYFLATLMIPLIAPPVRRMLRIHLWIAFRTGFGQSVTSVLAVVLILACAAAFIVFDTANAAHNGHGFPESAFAAYASGIGILLAQALLVRRIERDPVLRPQIETENAAHTSPLAGEAGGRRPTDEGSHRPW